MTASEERRLPTLDGWRAVAIVAVVACHALDPVFCAGAPHASALLYSLSRQGAIGVQIFFGISGFLICHRLVSELAEQRTIRLARFYVRRSFRILPPYLAYLAVVGGLAHAGAVPVSAKEFVSCLGFVRNYLPRPDGGGWYTGHFWSLAVEEHFYLLWPPFLALAGVRRALPCAIAAALVIAVWRAVDFHLGLVAALLPGAGFYGRTDVRLDGLLWGCVLALALSKAPARARWQRALTSWRWWLAAGALVGVLTVHPPLEMTWQALLIALLLAGTTLNPTRWVSRVLETAPMRLTGRISYGLYVWQQLVLVPFDGPHAIVGAAWPWPARVATSFALAVASYYAIERPMIRFGRYVASAALAPSRVAMTVRGEP